MSPAVAINVGANTNTPGIRGPVFPDGTFEFVPIPETEPTVEPPPTYADLALETTVPDPSQPVHLDPEFAEYPRGQRYTYGDPWSVKARPIEDLTAGDHLYFYATLTPHGTDHPDWVTPDWGAYLIGVFELARDPVTGDEYRRLPPPRKAVFASNAHVRRDPFDAAVLVAGTPDRSRLFNRAIPLSGQTGATPNRIVTDLSADSGRGPWWRRPLRFDEEESSRLAAIVRDGPPVT